MIKSLSICFLFATLFVGEIYGQNGAGIQLSRDYQVTSTPSPTLLLGTSLPSSLDLMPQYVQDNPTGYSYLCRLELDLEKKLPVPVWLKMEDNRKLSEGLTNNVYVRFKLLRF